MAGTDSSGALRLLVDPTDGMREATLACEADVFAERYGIPEAELRECYAPFEASSSFLSVVDSTDRVVGMARLIFPSPAGLVTLIDIGGPPWDVDPVESLAATGLDSTRLMDIATVAVRSLSAPLGRLCAAALYHGMIQLTRANGVEGFVALLDHRVRRMLAQLGVITHSLPGTRTVPYWGSDATTPVWANMAQLLDIQRRRYPDAYRLVALGVGLGEIDVPPLEAFVRDRAPIDLRTRIDLTSELPAQRAQRSGLNER